SDIKASLEEIKRAHNNINSLESLNKFIDNLPIICNKASFTKMMFLNLSPSKNIEVLDFLEFVAILEPWKKEYSLDILMHEITNIYEAKEGENLDECTKLMICVNSILLRQWEREESNGSKKKKKSMFTILTLDYGLKNRWNWTKYLEKPLMFTYEDYNYVNYEDNKVIKPNLKKIKIPYDENEDLLKRSEIWNNGNDFVYQYRESQRNFAGKIRENIEKEEKIFIEAPTGSGKTFAYVLIAALKAYKNKDTHKNEDASFIISTDTKELQSQLIQRDIPSILHKLNLEDKLNYGAIKGKGNYICVDRLSKYSNFDTSIYGVLAEVFLKRLCKDGLYGDIENINYWSYNHFSLGDYISDIVCDNEECNIEKCHRKCLLKKRYNELPSENITVVNHSLLASWPYSEKKKITHLIIDEAHNLMDKCYDFFSEEFSSYDFTESLKNLYEKEPTIYRQFTNLNAQNGMRESIELEKIKYWVKEIETYMSILLNKAIELKLAGGDYSFKCEFNLPPINLKSKIDSLRPFISNVKERIYGLYSLLNRYFNNITLEGEEGKDDREYIKINNYLTKLKEAFNTIDAFLEDDNKRKTAKTLEISNNYSYFRLTNTPLNIDEMFNEHILKDVKSTVFLSATMRINNSFNTIKYTLGQRDASELTVPKTFDLKRKTKIFVMNDIGRYNSLEFPKNSAEFIFNVSQKLNGHIMVLFTNNLRRKKVEEELLELTKNTAFEVHTHKKSIKYLNDKKRKVIILGSKGFFEGIDVPGDALTCVILDKIPNKNLEEPLLKAITTYKNRTYNDVNYPEICIKLKQVYGRLIRSVNDYGYFCIMDGGENLNVLRRLERDMSGPDFIFSNQKNLLASMNRDYYRWQTDNLRKIISSSNKESSFHDEARKMKSFWTEEENTNGLKVFKNGMFKINSKK
nr:ATP-dependent DNA helicase [Clostridium sp.]